MKENNIAKIYAKTFIELGESNKVDIAEEIIKLTETINVSNDLENVLFLDVFTNEEKKSVFKAISEKISLAPILVAAVNYLIDEKRISLLPLITKEVIVIDDATKGFLRGTIEGSADSISDEIRGKLIEALKKELGSIVPKLNYEKNEKITAGYKVTVGDYQLDATVDNQLRSFKESVLGK